MAKIFAPTLPFSENDSLQDLQLKTLPRLAILAGPAGIGKSRFFLENFSALLQESKDPFRRDLLYLLPSAEHRERVIDLMLRKEGSGFFGERILTFNRLMQQLLKAGDYSLITDAERASLLTEIIREKSGEYFSSVRNFPGFIEKINEFVGELKDSMMSLGTFQKKAKLLEKANPSLAQKYIGLFQIYEAYEARLEALGVRDYRDALFLLKETEKTKKAALPKFQHLFIDGFFDFSKSQLEFLGWLTQHSDRITLALTLEPSGAREDLFKIPLKTLRELEKLGFETVDLSKKENRRASSKSLQHVGKNIFSPQTGPLDSAKGFLVLEATGIRGEVEMIAREIRKVVRDEHLHFSDIAVILRRIGEYEGIIRTVFRDFQIPVEIHERERLRDAPLARTLASFFRILLEDWKREDLFNFLKSGYVEKDYHEVCSLEIRGLALGIISGRKRWLEELGNPLFEKIVQFQKRAEGEQTMKEWIHFTEEVMEDFGLTRIPPVFEENARRDFATLKRLRNLLEEIRRTSVSWGNPHKTFETFARELLALIEVDLFSLHERDKNRVQVYDISLARQKEYRVVFLAGLLEKYFPAEIREDPILSDEERRTAGLAERLPRQALERYFFYLGLTRAREKVILSYPRFDLEGREALPSFYGGEVQKLFKEPLPKIYYPVSQTLPRLEEVVEEREIEAHLIQQLFDRRRAPARKERAFTLSLYNRFVDKPSFRTLLSRILFNPSAHIETEAVKANFLPRGGIFRPTGLEAYGRCSYRYFASEILHLEEKEEGIDPKQVGILLHDVLENYWRERVEKGRKELGELEQAKAFVIRHLQELLEKEPLAGERAYRIELKKAQMQEWLCHMVEKEIEEGSPLEPLHPRYFEFKFGINPKEVGYLKLYDAYHEDILLRGKIDRIDVDPSGKYALVIDYKTGGTFQRQSLEFGTALQLPLYLMAIQQHLKLKPLGGEIYQISSAESKGFYLKQALEETGAETASRSIFNQKDFDAILERAVRFSRKFAQGITRGEIEVRPRECDDHCPYSSVCRIEKWRLPFIYQKIREEDKNGI